MKYYYFYVLYTADGYFYGGFTDNVQRRLATHESGNGAKFTRVKSRHPLKLIHYEEFQTKSEALKAEANFKKLTRINKEKYLLVHHVVKIW